MAGLGIYHYNARFYSPKLGRFLSPDTIVPGYANPQSWNRFSYVTNNPLRYIDPTGYRQCEEYQGQCLSENQMTQIWNSQTGGGSGGGGGGGSGGGGGYCAIHPGACGGGLPTPIPTPTPTVTLPTPTIPSSTGTPPAYTQTPSITPPTQTEPPNPSVFGLVTVGLLLHTAIVISELGLIAGEIVLAPMVPANPLIVVPLEIILVATSITLLDLDVAYWSYTYQVSTNPQEHQEFEILPPWGFDQ